MKFKEKGQTTMANHAHIQKICLGLLITGCSLLWQVKSFADAWVEEKGDALTITSAGWYVSTRSYDEKRHRHGSPRYRELKINPYVEYGATDRLTVGTSIFVADIDAHKSDGPRETGFEEVDLFARYLIWADENSVFTVKALIKLPGNASTAQAAVGGADQIDIEVDALYGIAGQFFKTDNYWFAEFRVGPRKRFEKPADEIRAGFLLGLKTCEERLWFMLKEDSIFGLRNEDHNGPNYDLHTIEPSVLYWFTDYAGVQGGVRYDFYGRNVGVGWEPYVALWVRI
jgi:hypothetical protein